MTPGTVPLYPPSSEDPEVYDEQLAQDYNVSTLVVRHQLVNAGIGFGEA